MRRSLPLIVLFVIKVLSKFEMNEDKSSIVVDGVRYLRESDISTEHSYQFGSNSFTICLLISIFLVLVAGTMSGLSVGLFSLDKLKLELIRIEGSNQDKQRALKVAPLLNRHHHLLVTLLLANAIAMEALPIFLDRLMPSYLAVIFSVSFVLIFGEVIPQSLCTRNPLAIGAFFSPLVQFLMVLSTPISVPIAMVLDWTVGSDENALYKRSELKALVDLHSVRLIDSPRVLRVGEADILKGALDISSTSTEDAMTPISRVFMLSADSVLDGDLLRQIVARGYSRVPVFKGSRDIITGVLLVKSLLALDLSKPIPVCSLKLLDPLFCQWSESLYEMLKKFRKAKTHLAIVKTESSRVVGVLSIEDVFEHLIRNEIWDELDHYAGSQISVSSIDDFEMPLLSKNSTLASVVNRNVLANPLSQIRMPMRKKQRTSGNAVSLEVV